MYLERKLLVAVRDGLHARPATQFVKLARGFEAAIEIERNGKRANAKSSVKLMLLGVKEQDEVILHIDGADADTALDRLAAFILSPAAGQEAAADSQGQTPPPAAPVAADAGPLLGIPASEGVAMGPAFAFFPETLEESPHAIQPADIAAELARQRAAVAGIAADLAARKSGAGIDADDAVILDALLDVARDEEFLGAIETVIRGGLDAVTATLRAGRELSDSFAAMDDPYIRARAEDIRAVARSIALALLGRHETSLASLPPGAILVADEVSAWDLAKADLASIAGILCRKGAAVSHVSIMARAHGIPAVVGSPIAVERLREAGTLALNGRTGEVHLDPDADTRARIAALIEQERQARAALDAWRTAEAVTRDGRRIEIAANLGTLKEIDAALRAGAQGVGLFRTEFLFMERKTLPSEDEQATTYRRLAEAFAPHAVVVRTLDVGGDKPVAGIEFPHEDNPFLGWRGVRMCLERPDIFKPQLKALLRAAVVGNLKVMVPMVVDASEVAAVRRLIAECRAELAAAGVAHADFALGIMVETPAAALLADELAAGVAFFSIGTNDLTQYVMAADRLNPRVATLNRTEHPAVMRAIELVCQAARRACIPVAICGEAAARPDLIPDFVRLGVTELSMSPAAIPRAKKCVAEI
jgi:phosphoenolpyruvate-protein phosphotransferase (PTS system enzyme I)